MDFEFRSKGERVAKDYSHNTITNDDQQHIHTFTQTLSHAQSEHVQHGFTHARRITHSRSFNDQRSHGFARQVPAQHVQHTPAVADDTQHAVPCTVTHIIHTVAHRQRLHQLRLPLPILPLRLLISTPKIETKAKASKIGSRDVP